MTALDRLHDMRKQTGPATTAGLSDDTLAEFLREDRHGLEAAITAGWQEFQSLKNDHPEWLSMAEADLVSFLQQGIVNFYPAEQINPYVPLAAKGPWIVTSHGAVIHDSGGYGMLGAGQNPDTIFAAMCKPVVMANVMTASRSQKELISRLHKEVGHSRSHNSNLFSHFVFLNSGSESVTLATRIADRNTQQHLEQNPGKYKEVKFLSLKGSFHGRTERPAMASDSTLPKYQVLHSFKSNPCLITVEPNNVDQLEQAFVQAAKDKVFIECILMEPVMGEGNPGQAVSPEFYRAARKLATENNALLVVDSIQAGFRGQGCLSLMDYPGFQQEQAPDMETYSKALNAGQYPLSIVAMNERAAKIYTPGIYGNTMTTNPRALEVAIAVLDGFDDELRSNIKSQGEAFVAGFNALKEKHPGKVLGVNGTGLLCAIELDPSYPVVGFNGVETYLRTQGIGVIHGGKNALRFTPHFKIADDEVKLVIDAIDAALSLPASTFSKAKA